MQQFTDDELAVIAEMASYHAAAINGYTDTYRQTKHKRLERIWAKASGYRPRIPEGTPTEVLS